MQNFEASALGWFWSTNVSGELTYLSASLASAISEEPESLLGTRFADVFVQADDDLTGRTTLPFILARQGRFEKVTIRAFNDQDQRYWSVSGAPQFDREERFIGYRGTAIDVTEQRKSSEHASQLAKYDALTGLPNRRRMAEILDASLVAASHQQKPCAVLLIDLDRFKQVNDTLGHPAGDALLKQVAERLSRIVGDRERVFRLGGDEFQVVLPNCQDRGIIGDMAGDIISSLSQPYSVEGSRCIIGASVGIAVAPVDGGSRGDLIRNADLALYAAKTGGRGRFRFFSEELLAAAEERRILEEDIRDALARGEFTLSYQPIVNAVSNKMTGAEALIRWEHPTRGAISPALFIPIAEEAGLICQLGEWVLRQACHDAARWPRGLRVAVNVSPTQFSSESFLATLTSALAASGLVPDRLELEITEGVFLGDSPSTDTMFAALKSVGVRLALDDFGTGYSSLGYLRTAPFDKIKIDKTFVRAATLPGSRNGAIIAAIVALAEALDMETTAEGIEYMDQLNLVRCLRVSHVQGWVYSKAVTCEELSQRLQQGDWIIEPSGPSKQRSNRRAVYRKAGVIHGSRYRSVIMRNLSETGALIEGFSDLPVGALIVVDFGEGQLTFARVARAEGSQLGIAFEQELVDDGNGGLCTSHRVSQYLLSSLGLPTPGDADKSMEEGHAPLALEELAKRLGLTLAPRARREDVLMNLQWSATTPGQEQVPTFREVSERYLETLADDEHIRESAKRDLRNHILPRFGQLRLDEVSGPDIATWLAAKNEVEGPQSGTDSRLHGLLSQIWSMAVKMKLPGTEADPLQGCLRLDRRGQGDREDVLSVDEADALLCAAKASRNSQLKYIVSLLMLTGARPSEVVRARWDDVDIEAGLWRLHPPGAGAIRELRLSSAACSLIAALPRRQACPFLLPNPVTGQPYRSIDRSWEAARVQAGVPSIEIDDLRYCDLGTAIWEARLLKTLSSDGMDLPDLARNEAGDDATAELSQAA
jgi:diguanylate cyclase (GGDEF)-like protein